MTITRFIPNTDKDRKEMMAVTGISDIGELFKDVPREKLFRGKLKLPDGISEMELRQQMTDLSEENRHRMACFLGAGIYNHFIPSVVNHLVSRSEFYTAYTPYQAEISQGVLQAIYEWQTFISELCGTDLANASMYDGSTALAEGALMAVSITKRNELVVSSAVNPEYRQVVRTYAEARDLNIVEVDFEDGVTSLERLGKTISDTTAAVLVQYPNFFGSVEDMAAISKLAHGKGALLVVCVSELTSLGLLRPPGEHADIVAGEAQSFGNPMSFGGPCVGFIATKKEHVRQVPGRLAGVTADMDGKRGYTLTLQSREQQVRRARASSNICSNEALCALAATVWMATVGKELKGIAELNLQKAHFVYEELRKLGFEGLSAGPFYNEFVVRCKDTRKVQEELLKNGIVGGLDIGRYYPRLKDCLLFCVTEMNSRKEIDGLLKAMGGLKK